MLATKEKMSRLEAGNLALREAMAALQIKLEAAGVLWLSLELVVSL